jgi:hypothetical protein
VLEHPPGPRRSTGREQIPQWKETILAAGMVTASDKITVELVDDEDLPQMTLVRWPTKATRVRPGAYAVTAGKIMRVLARANVELTRIRMRRL